jgi:hypothetical protein
MYGDLGEHVTTAAILMRDMLLRPGFVLPRIRLAPVAPYGKCMALSGNGASLKHVDTLPNGVVKAAECWKFWAGVQPAGGRLEVGAGCVSSPR